MDYRVTVSVRNNRILELGEQLGLPNAAAIARAAGLTPGMVGRYVNLQQAPIGVEGTWKESALKIADALCCEPDDLWSDEQKYMELPSNKAHRLLDAVQVASLMQDTQENLYLAEQTTDIVHRALAEIEGRGAEILRMRHGIAPYDRSHTLEEVGKKFRITRERVRHLEMAAMRRIRNPRHPLRPSLKELLDKENPVVRALED